VAHFIMVHYEEKERIKKKKKKKYAQGWAVPIGGGH
jgi:hypothetical protein